MHAVYLPSKAHSPIMNWTKQQNHLQVLYLTTRLLLRQEAREWRDVSGQPDTPAGGGVL